MFEAVEQSELRAQTQRLLRGPLQHARAAALAVALVPLAAVAVGTVATSESCPSAGVCGIVFYDANNNGIQEPTSPQSRMLS